MSRSLSSLGSSEYVEQDFLTPLYWRSGAWTTRPGAELGVGPVADHEPDQVEVAAHAEPLQRCLPHGSVLVQVDAMTRAAERFSPAPGSFVARPTGRLLLDGVVFRSDGK